MRIKLPSPINNYWPVYSALHLHKYKEHSHDRLEIHSHIHLLPPDVIENNWGNGDRFVEYGSVDDYLRLMDQYHIEAACVMPFNDPYMLSMDFQASSVHNNLLAMCLQAENCLFCFADIDIRNPVETTLELLEKALEQKKFWA